MMRAHYALFAAVSFFALPACVVETREPARAPAPAATPAPTPTPAVPPPVAESSAENCDRPGSDYTNVRMRGDQVVLCAQTCRDDAKCRAWSFVHATSTCYLKNTVPASTVLNGVACGVIR